MNSMSFISFNLQPIRERKRLANSKRVSSKLGADDNDFHPFIHSCFLQFYPCIVSRPVRILLQAFNDSSWRPALRFDIPLL